MGFIKDNNVYVLEASLTFKGRKNFFNILDSNINKIAYFSLSDTDINYDIASQVSNVTQSQNIPANGFIPDFTGDYVLCIKSAGKGVDESSLTSFICKTPITANIQYVWDSINIVCQTNELFSSSVISGNHNSGLAISKNILKTINGVYQNAYNISVPINFLGNDLHDWLTNTQNTIEQISSDNIEMLTSGRTITNYSFCPLDIDFTLNADQISTVASNDTFVTVLNISGGTGIYKLSVDNGLTYNTINGSQYQFNGLPENQLRSVIVKDSQINPYITKKSITTPNNIVVTQSVMALVTEFSATPNFLPVQGGSTTLKMGISQAVTADTIFTLSNGQNITIFNGNTTNSITYNVPNNSGSTQQSSLTINIINISNTNISAPSNKNNVTIIIDTWVDFNPKQYVCEQTDGGTISLNNVSDKNTQRVLNKQHLNSDINQTRFIVDNTYPNPEFACPVPLKLSIINFNGSTNKTINGTDIGYDIIINSSATLNNPIVRVRVDTFSGVDPNLIVDSSILNYTLFDSNGISTRHFNANRQIYTYNTKYTIIDNGGTYTIGSANVIDMLNPKTGVIQTGSGVGCLLAGQGILIDVKYKTKLIENIKIGDFVYTKHEFKNEFGLYKVIGAITLNVDHYYKITTLNNKIIKCSASHLFMINGMKQRADELTLNKELMILNGGNFENVGIKSIEIINEPTTVYKLEIDDAHTYITENLIYNHNKV